MRPKKTPKILPEGWQDDILDLYAEGASDVEIRAYIAEATGTFHQHTWERWIYDGEEVRSGKDRSDMTDEEQEQYTEFLLIIKKGRLLCQTWWEREGRTNLNNPKFNPTLWYMNMKNRFKWKDNHEEETGDITININEIRQKTL